MRNEVNLKRISIGYVKMHGFHGNPFYDSREWGKDYKFNPIWGSTYHSALILVSD